MFVRRMSIGERAGWNRALDLTRDARRGGWSPAVLADALDHAADRADRAVDSLTRRGLHELAAVSADVAVVLDHVVGRVGEHLARQA